MFFRLYLSNRGFNMSVNFEGVSDMMTWGSSKLIAVCAGVFSSLTFSLFWQPKWLKEKSLLFVGTLTGFVSANLTFLFVGTLSRLMGLNTNNPDDALSVGAIIGVFALFIVGGLAEFFKKYEGRAITEVAVEVKKDLFTKPNSDVKATVTVEVKQQEPTAKDPAV